MNELIVETRAGKVRGKKERGFDDIEFCSFKGIPYAKPPVGELRFSDAQPLEFWTGIRDATSHGPNCAQMDFFTQQFIGSEDCLYLNVYTRYLSPQQRWPVMVWIHGGGFLYGSGDDSFFGPDYFMPKDVVLVTINYRLGVLGFLNLDDESATGNHGLKDQLMALKWVRDNVANFGGDPSNVTVFGQSAGGASVHYLTLSPLAKGLFHKGIAQSGVALNPWATHPNSKEKAYRLCEELGHTSKDSRSIVEFLRSVDAKKLIEAQAKILTIMEKAMFEFPFGPSIDSKSEVPFLDVHPEEAIGIENEIPLIIGYVSREGMVYTKELLENWKEFKMNPSKIVHPNTQNAFKKLYNLTADDLARIYFNSKPVTNVNDDELTDFVGFLYFYEGIKRVIESRIAKNCAPTYVYQFTYDKDLTMFKSMMNSSGKKSGVIHGDDIEFFFRPYYCNGTFDTPKGSVKHKVSQQVIELWVNFATTGTPTPKFSESLPVNWQPVVEKTRFHYLNICENLRMEVTPYIGHQYIERQYSQHVPWE